MEEEKAWMKVLESRGKEIKSKTKLEEKNWQKKYDNVPFLRGERGKNSRIKIKKKVGRRIGKMGETVQKNGTTKA
jgi:hypothetical protein